jgi:hypothetical protein
MTPATCPTPTASPGSPTSAGALKKQPTSKSHYRNLAASIATLRKLPQTPATRRRINRLANDFALHATQQTQIPFEEWDFFFHQEN